MGDAVWPVLDILAVGIAAYFAIEDLKNRDENVKRIWAEVQKRGAQKYAHSPDPLNRSGHGAYTHDSG